MKRFITKYELIYEENSKKPYDGNFEEFWPNGKILRKGHFLAGKKTGERNPWKSTTIEWSAPSPPLPHVNFDSSVEVNHGPYEYSVPGQDEDYCPQTSP